jgi:hypothetical protein
MTWGMSSQYPLHRRLGGPQSVWVWRERVKSLPLLRIEPPVTQPITYSLYWLIYFCSVSVLDGLQMMWPNQRRSINWRYINNNTNACHWTWSWASSIHLPPSQRISVRSTLVTNTVVTEPHNSILLVPSPPLNTIMIQFHMPLILITYLHKIQFMLCPISFLVPQVKDVLHPYKTLSWPTMVWRAEGMEELIHI